MAHQADNVLIFLLFCSLRLSVRTPPFHGGESGSIPLGSASYFNGLAPSSFPMSNTCPIYAGGLRSSATISISREMPLRGARHGWLDYQRGDRRRPLHRD